MSINVYWSQLFIFTKGVLKKINALCRAFLWFGTYEDSRHGSLYPETTFVYLRIKVGLGLGTLCFGTKLQLGNKLGP